MQTTRNKKLYKNIFHTTGTMIFYDRKDCKRTFVNPDYFKYFKSTACPNKTLSFGVIPGYVKPNLVANLNHTRHNYALEYGENVGNLLKFG